MSINANARLGMNPPAGGELPQKKQKAGEHEHLHVVSECEAGCLLKLVGVSECKVYRFLNP